MSEIIPHLLKIIYFYILTEDTKLYDQLFIKLSKVGVAELKSTLHYKYVYSC